MSHTFDRAARADTPSRQRPANPGTPSREPHANPSASPTASRPAPAPGRDLLGIPVLAPPPVHDALSRPGRPLEAPVRERMEARLGHDFSRVRVHADGQAARSAGAVGADAYAVGSDVVFGPGRYAPRTRAGEFLLAHELAHTVQQRDAAPSRELSVAAPDHPAERYADRAVGGERVTPSVASQILMRHTIFDEIAGLFKGDDFPKTDLDTYIGTIDKAGVIEDYTDSDNKARAVVKMWAADHTAFALTPKLKALLIEEMLSGWTSEGDERGILILLQTGGFADLSYIFGAAGVTAKRLDSKISGANNDELRAFLTSRFDGTIADIIAGKGKLRELPTPYKTASLTGLLDDRGQEIASAIAGIADTNDQYLKLRQLAHTAALELAAEIAKMAGPEHEKAVNDMRTERVARDQVYDAARRDIAAEKALETSDPANAATHRANVARLTDENHRRWAAVVILDDVLSGIAAEVALATPKADLAKQVTPLTPAQQTAAQESLKSPVASAKGTFIDTLPGEKLSYRAKLMARAPILVDQVWNKLAKNRTAKEHVKKNLHALDELEVMANAAAKEVNNVFGSYKTKPPFKADKLSAKGTVVKPGTIHDAWQSEDAKGADPGVRADTAANMLFYLLENDAEIKAINFSHNARPALKEDHTPLNKEGGDLAAAGNARLAIASERQRLFEINRAWDAFNTAGEVSVQTFRGKTDADDRKYLWEMFFILMHEYLHSLSAPAYQAVETKLGGEATGPGNTLIEGVDSYLTEIVWTQALPRASLPEVRNAVEPEYVNKGLPFDASLLPVMPQRRYPNYDKAAKLVAVVGIKNLYAAYFLGDMKAIGQ